MRRERAEAAVETSRQALADVRSQWPEVLARREEARRIREENHLAELVRRNLRGRPA